MPFPSPLRFLTQGDSSIDVEEHPFSIMLHPLPGPLTPDSDVISLSQHHYQIARALLSFMPATCRRISPKDVELIGGYPIAAGGFADVWKAMYNGRMVVLKSYRCYVDFDVARVAVRYHNETRACSLLHLKGVGVVPFIGIYSTEEHPFGLIYEYMDGLDLNQCLRSQSHVCRLKLLTDIAQGLSRMHNIGIVHGGLKTANVLVDEDGIAHLAGLGNAHILLDFTVTAMEGEMSVNRAHQPELNVPGVSPGDTDATYPTKAGDMYAFGFIIFEILTGHSPFFELTATAAMYSMLKGDRPDRPNYQGITDVIWRVVEQCWDFIPSQRMSSGEVVRLLVEEL